uniref:Pyr_redox_2 domain-containing protein n=2 Tax=Caenorhabditis japonica TaxID=281687 RepID=A0A8R1IA95_CAEJA
MSRSVRGEGMKEWTKEKRAKRAQRGRSMAAIEQRQQSHFGWMDGCKNAKRNFAESSFCGNSKLFFGAKSRPDSLQKTKKKKKSSTNPKKRGRMPTGCCAKFDTHVLIIGNGPAGIALSAFLSGMQPFYDERHPHQNAVVHEKLLANYQLSLIDQDLSWSSNLTELSQSGRPLSVLYDMLVRPGADMGSVDPGSLQWKLDKSRDVPHMVIGETKIGGSWNEYDPEMLTVSFSDWMDMPGFTMEQWLGGRPLVKRLPSCAVASYLKRYVENLRIRKKFHQFFVVSSIKKVEDVWITEGTRSTDGRKFVIRSKSVVVACGKTSPKTLQLPNEENCSSRIVYDVRALKEKLDATRKTLSDVENYDAPSTSTSAPVIVVGDGVTSVDCVRHCLERDTPVVHVIRRNLRELRNVTLSRLSPMHYSEYTEIYRMMIGRSSHKNYQRILEANLTSISKFHVEITTPSECIQMPYSSIAVCIGRESHFSKVFESPPSFLDYRSPDDDTLYAVGSFAGDHFVRFLVGGCLRVAQHLTGTHCTNNNVIDKTPL